MMEFEGGYQAVITYDPEIEMFRGEFVGLNGGADFYAKDAETLKREGKTSLDVFLHMCAEDGVQPERYRGSSLCVFPPKCTTARRWLPLRKGSPLTALSRMRYGRQWWGKSPPAYREGQSARPLHVPKPCAQTKKHLRIFS